MIVVCDTSTICYLILIGEIDLLPRFFGTILIPPGVCSELASPGAPDEVRAWIRDAPDWLEVRAPGEPGSVDPTLHPGEREVLALAIELDADLVILDDKPARQAATDRGLPLTGLLGILDRAASEQEIDLRATVRRLRQTSFRAAPSLLKALLDRH